CLLVLNGAIKDGGEFTVYKKKYKMRTVAENQEILQNHKNKLSEIKESDNLEYWDMIAELNIDLCLLLILEDENIDAKWKEITQNFNKIWSKAGSEAKKNSEIEHLQFLTDGLNAIAGLKNTLSIPNKDLQSHISNLRTALSAVRKKINSKQIANPKPADIKKNSRKKTKKNP